MEFSTQDLRRGMAGESVAIFYHLVGGRDAIFLGFCVWLAGVDRTLRALSFLALRRYPVCGFPLSFASLI